jgi:predicted aminopeptidase
MRLAVAGAVTVAVGAALVAHPDTRVGYVARAARGQAELLWRRVPLDDVLAHDSLGPSERARVTLVRDVKRWGREQAGLAHTDNYETLAVGWSSTIWNVSACEPLAFEPVQLWFPVVGRVPYLGFFDEGSADRWVGRMRDRGLDVHKRTAGAYSTLGWFRDPLLPGMLEWDEDRLIETLLHELTHSTLWIPGSVTFNESFASFFGEQALLAYLADRWGPDHPRVQQARTRLADDARYQALLHEVFQDLDAVYTDPALTDRDRQQRKEALLGSLPARGARAGFSNPDRFVETLRPAGWNNARLMQFRTYNHSQDWFAALLAAEDGDLASLLSRVAALTRGAADPEGAIQEAARAAGHAAPLPAP